MAPVDVRDVAAAVKEVLLREDTAGQTLSLQGPDVFTWEQLVRMVFKVIREPERAYYVPQQLGVLAAKPREFLQAHVPFPVPVLPAPLYTSDNVLASSVDYVAPPGAPGAQRGLPGLSRAAAPRSSPRLAAVSPLTPPVGRPAPAQASRSLASPRASSRASPSTTSARSAPAATSSAPTYSRT